MKTIRSKDAKIQRKAAVSDNAPFTHVVFFINDEQASYSKPGKMYKTESGALKAAQNWVDNGK